MKNIRIIIVDDHNVMRAALVEHLSRLPEMEIIGEVTEYKNILRTASDLSPDVILLDAQFVGHKIIEIIQLLQIHNPSIQILVFSAYCQYDFIVSLLKAGISGLVLREDTLKNLVEAIRAVNQNEEWLSSRSIEILINSVTKQNGKTSKLTNREQEVINLIATGYKNSEIAAELVITVQTVKNHIRNIFNKLGVESRVEAALYGINHGYVNINEQAKAE